MKTQRWVEIEAVLGYGKAFASWGENLQVFVARENGEWNLSISHPNRYPTWDEIHDARYQLLPNEITVAMILPPKKEYVNIHSNCFHLHEIKGERDFINAR